MLQKNIEKSGGASRWRVCYQRGLPRLVFVETYYQFKICISHLVSKRLKNKKVFWTMRQTSEMAKGTQFHWYRLF